MSCVAVNRFFRWRVFVLAGKVAGRGKVVVVVVMVVEQWCWGCYYCSGGGGGGDRRRCVVVVYIGVPLRFAGPIG